MQKLLNKFFTPGECALIRKDFAEIWSQKMVRSSLFILPLMMSFGLPLFFLLITALAPLEEIDIGPFRTLLGSMLPQTGARGQMFYVFTNLICPMLFVMIPLMTSSVSASCTFVGEKERGTMETLLLSPLSVRKLFQAKVAGCALLAGMITLISFAVFFIIMVIGCILTGAPFFFNLNWFILVFLMSPALMVLGVVFMVMVSGRSKTTVEAMQVSGYIIFPIMLLFVGQISGLFVLEWWMLLAATAVIAAVDLLLLNRGFAKFTAEKLLS